VVTVTGVAEKRGVKVNLEVEMVLEAWEAVEVGCSEMKVRAEVARQAKEVARAEREEEEETATGIHTGVDNRGSLYQAHIPSSPTLPLRPGTLCSQPQAPESQPRA
jgi:hypothetical protein